MKAIRNLKTDIKGASSAVANTPKWERDDY